MRKMNRKINAMNTMKIKFSSIHFPKRNRKMNKKGFLRIIEAVIGILIIMTAVLIIASNRVDNVDISDEVYEKQRYILDSISNNEDMRLEIIKDKTILTNSFISKNIPGSWNFTTNICEVDEVCNQGTPNDRDVYVSETIISATLKDYPNDESRKLRFFVWRK